MSELVGLRNIHRIEGVIRIPSTIPALWIEVRMSRVPFITYRFNSGRAGGITRPRSRKYRTGGILGCDVGWGGGGARFRSETRLTHLNVRPLG